MKSLLHIHNPMPVKVNALAIPGTVEKDFAVNRKANPCEYSECFGCVK